MSNILEELLNPLVCRETKGGILMSECYHHGIVETSFRRIYYREPQKNHQFIPFGYVCMDCGQVSIDKDSRIRSRARIQKMELKEES